MNRDIQKAIEVLKRGGIVIYPTDTAFGIGCRIDNAESIDKLFALRKRPVTQATPVLVASNDMALSYFENPGIIVRRLMDAYWPGALTIVAHCKTNLIHSPVRGGGNTIGIRMPDHDMLLELIRRVGLPILGTSANFHGKQTPFAVEDLDPELVSLVDFVLPGKRTKGNVSTVIDTTTNPPKILRQGAIEVDPAIFP